MFTQGQRCFSDSGREVEYLAPLPNGFHLVYPFLEADDYEYRSPEPTVVERLFAEAPTQVKNAELAELEAQIASKRDELRMVNSDIRGIQATREKLLAKLQDVPELQRIADWLDGKITCFVVHDNYSLSFKAFSEIGEGTDSERDMVRLLCLTGDATTKGISWKFNRYKDGSGSWTDCIPCADASEQMAAGQKIADAWWRQRDRDCAEHVRISRIRSCLAHGLTVPPDARDLLARFDVDLAQKKLTHAKHELASYQAKVDALIAKLAQSNPLDAAR